MAKTSRLRESCDRCLSSKVRCSRGKPACSRCIDSGYDCLYSPTRPTGRPKKGTQTSNPPGQNSQDERPANNPQRDGNAASINEQTVTINDHPDIPLQSSVDNNTTWMAQDGLPWAYNTDSFLDMDTSIPSILASNSAAVNFDSPFHIDTTAWSDTSGMPSMFSTPTIASSTTTITEYPGVGIQDADDRIPVSTSFPPSECASLASLLVDNHSSWTGTGHASQLHHKSSISTTRSSVTDLQSLTNSSAGEVSRKSCYLAASDILRKLTERQPTTIRVDSLLEIHREIKQTVQSILNCRHCLERESNHTIIMLIFMLLENFLACLEARLEASNEGRGGSNVHMFLSSSKPLVIGKFTVDRKTKTEFVSGLVMEALDTHLALLVRLEAKADSALKGVFRGAAGEMAKGMRERLSLVRGLFLVSEITIETTS